MYCYSRNKYKKSVLSVLEYPETSPRARALLVIPEGIGNPLRRSLGSHAKSLRLLKALMTH